MNSTASSTIVQRVWNYCNVLRDDGVSYGDYVEQLTYLLFLKMDHESATMLGKPSAVATDFNWASLLSRDGDELEAALYTYPGRTWQGCRPDPDHLPQGAK